MKNSGLAQFAVVMLQPQCNMHCSFCITENSLHKASWEDALDLLEQLKSKNIQNLVLGGGEPFYWPHNVLKLSQVATNMGFHIQIGTNGIELPKGFQFEESVKRYVLPLESVEDGIHNALRQYKKRHCSIIKQALKNLAESRKEVSISTVLTKVNLNYLQGLKDFLVQYQSQYHNIHAWHLYQFVPAGRGGRLENEKLQISKENYWGAVHSLKQDVKDFKVFARPDMYHSKTVGFYWFNGKSWLDTQPPVTECQVY